MNIIHKVPSILVPMLDNYDDYVSGRIQFQNLVTCEQYRKGDLIHTQQVKNTFMTLGMAKILNVVFGNVSKAGSAVVCCGIFKANVVPVVGDTAAKLGSGHEYLECQDADYSPATNRPVYNIATTSTATATNSAAKAEFTMAAAITVYGAFLTYGASSTQAKTSVADTLMCAAKFGSARTTEIADLLAIKYDVIMTTS